MRGSRVRTRGMRTRDPEAVRREAIRLHRPSSHHSPMIARMAMTMSANSMCPPAVEPRESSLVGAGGRKRRRWDSAGRGTVVRREPFAVALGEGSSMFGRRLRIVASLVGAACVTLGVVAAAPAQAQNQITHFPIRTLPVRPYSIVAGPD